MKRWTHRCATCGNPRHFLAFYIRGWLLWHLLVRPWPHTWGVPPLLAYAGDYIFDHRGCEPEHGPETYLEIELGLVP
jgi:hypothetical protein